MLPKTPNESAFTATTPARKSNLSLLLLFVITLLFGAVGGYYLGVNKNQLVTPSQLTTPPSQQTNPLATPDETANWKTYTNEKYGFEFKYPENYSYTDKFKIQEESSFSTFYELNFKKDIYKNVAQNPAIHFVAINTTKDIQTYLHDELQQEISSWETFKKESGLYGNEIPNINKTENVIINTISFTKVSRERSPSAPNNKEIQYFFKKGDVLYILYTNYGSYNPDTKEDGSSEIKTLDQILSTFKFLD